MQASFDAGCLLSLGALMRLAAAALNYEIYCILDGSPSMYRASQNCRTTPGTTELIGFQSVSLLWYSVIYAATSCFHMRRATDHSPPIFKGYWWPAVFWMCYRHWRQVSDTTTFPSSSQAFWCAWHCSELCSCCGQSAHARGPFELRPCSSPYSVWTCWQWLSCTITWRLQGLCLLGLL